MRSKRLALLAVPRFPTQRVAGLTDGVFAIVLTLLVLELKLPNPPLPGSRILEELAANLPEMIGWVLSFIILARLWLIHHHALGTTPRCSPRSLLANLVFIATISLVPFAANIVGAYEFSEPMALIVFSIMLASTSLALGLTLWCFTCDARAAGTASLPWAWAMWHHLITLPVLAFIATLIANVQTSIAAGILMVEAVSAIVVLFLVSWGEPGLDSARLQDQP